MKFLKIIFIFFAIYGFVVSLYGAAMIALCVAAFIYYAEGVYAKQDAHPNKAKPIQAPTSDALTQQECECCNQDSGPRFPT